MNTIRGNKMEKNSRKKRRKEREMIAKNGIGERNV
jgi:hypothetical protein